MKQPSVYKKNLIMLKNVWKVKPLYFFQGLLLVVLQVAQSVLFILINKVVIDILTKQGSFSDILYFSLALLAVTVTHQFYSSWFYMKQTKLVTLKVQEAMQKEIFQKALELDLACYESGSFYDQYVRAMAEADNRAMNIFNTFLSFAKNLLSIVSIIAIILTISAPIFIFIAAQIILSVVLSQGKNKRLFTYRQQEMALNRHREYIKRVFYLPEYAKELKIFPVARRLLSKYTHKSKDLYETTKKHFSVISLFDGGTGALMSAITVGMTLFLCAQVLLGAVSVGAFMALERSASTITASIGGLFSLITDLKNHGFYIDNYLAFMAYKPQILSNLESAEIDKGKALSYELKNVSFRYGADAPDVLKNISLRIQSGEKIAIVGYNGAGKTTLSKLLLRLYDSTEGAVIINGRPVREYNVSSLWKAVGVVFQDSKYYCLPIKDNIASDETSYSEEEIYSALQKANLGSKISSLKEGINTEVSRELSENGAGFSGGELQSLYLARVFLHNQQTLILDEPSSMLDPISEHKMLSAIFEGAQNKTIIMIAHRLSCIPFVDRILFFEQGHLTEEGTHEELMSLNGKYAEMYRIQAKQYFQV